MRGLGRHQLGQILLDSLLSSVLCNIREALILTH
jgi:hypothetical protein